MKHTLPLLITLCTLFNSVLSQAQVFDSASYVQHYQQRLSQSYYTPTLSSEDKLAGLSRAWAEAKFNFANFDLIPTLNWDSVYHSYIPKAMAAKDVDSYYKVLQQFYQHLRDGHSSISQPPAYWEKVNATLPLKAKWVEEKAVITQLLSTDKAYAALQPGTIIKTIDGMDVQQYIQQRISPYLNFSTAQDSIARIYSWELFTGNADQPVVLGFTDVSGKKQSASFRRLEFRQLMTAMPLLDFKVMDGNIGYLQLNSFNDNKIVALFDSLFPIIAKTNALIIDVRNNGGGNGSNGHEILGCLTSKPFMQGMNAIRHYIPPHRGWNAPDELHMYNYDWKPYKQQLYTKPVAVLVGPDTYSAAEDFLVAFKSINRGKLFGQATGGSTGQPAFFELPGGGMGRVCAKRDMMADGTEFIGKGIMPDVPVNYTIEKIRQGRDEVLEAAQQFLTREISIKQIQ